jgi:class 3 adenylate cyclase
MAEPIPHASVVVVVMEGMDEVFASGDIEANRDLLHRLVDRLDVLTRRRGLERVKVVGDAYVAVSASKASNLDYAPRAVGFAADAISEVTRIAVDAGASIAGAAGVATGSITEGLIGDSRLVFDVWGVPADEALALARAAAPGQVLVTAVTRERLPGDTRADERDVPGVGTAWVIEHTPIDVGNAT